MSKRKKPRGNWKPNPNPNPRPQRSVSSFTLGSWVEEFEAFHHLPSIRGVSDRQVRYARSMRYRYLSQAKTIAKTMDPETRETFRKWLGKIKTNQSARAWIDRATKTVSLLTEFETRDIKQDTPRLAPLDWKSKARFKASAKAQSWKQKITAQAQSLGLVE